jgi:hypothetical protein
LVRRRLQPLYTAPLTPLTAVVRIESDAKGKTTLSAAQRHAAVERIMEVVRLTKPSGLQLDFDARVSERTFYGLLLRDLRALLPEIWISITALVSWCGEHSWLKNLPVDEVVPMLFRMGNDAPSTRYRLRRGGDFIEPRCRTSVGISLDENSPPSGVRRRYIFNSKPWTPATVEEALSRK